MANKYSKKIRLGVGNYNTETHKYNDTVETNYLGTLSFVIEIYDLKKETQTGGLIVGNMDVDGQQIAIRENDYNGNKRWSGTLSRDASNKGNARVNINKVISANPVKEYEMVVVEVEQEPRKEEETPDLPF